MKAVEATIPCAEKRETRRGFLLINYMYKSVSKCGMYNFESQLMDQSISRVDQKRMYAFLRPCAGKTGGLHVEMRMVRQ